MKRLRRIDMTWGRLAVAALTWRRTVDGYVHDVPCTITGVDVARTPHYRVLHVQFADGTDALRRSNNVTVRGQPSTMLYLKSILAKPTDNRVKRARVQVEVARLALKRTETRIKRLETAASSWRRKLAARERALQSALEAADPGAPVQ